MRCHKAEVSCTIRGSHDGPGQDAAINNEGVFVLSPEQIGIVLGFWSGFYISDSWKRNAINNSTCLHGGWINKLCINNLRYIFTWLFYIYLHSTTIYFPVDISSRMVDVHCSIFILKYWKVEGWKGIGFINSARVIRTNNPTTSWSNIWRWGGDEESTLLTSSTLTQIRAFLSMGGSAT